MLGDIILEDILEDEDLYDEEEIEIWCQKWHQLVSLAHILGMVLKSYNEIQSWWQRWLFLFLIGSLMLNSFRVSLQCGCFGCSLSSSLLLCCLSIRLLCW